MFTGMIEELGTVVERGDDYFVFSGGHVLDDARVGCSIAVNGCCLTATSIERDSWTADLSEETRRCTTFDYLQVGDPVNLERPLRIVDRMAGHVVQGHVDGVGHVVEQVPDLRIRIPDRLLPFVVDKGSISVDGVSLTIAALYDDGFGIAVIPHTASNTNLGSLKPGDAVNIETDIMAKYVNRLTSFATVERVANDHWVS